MRNNLSPYVTSIALSFIASVLLAAPLAGLQAEEAVKFVDVSEALASLKEDRWYATSLITAAFRERYRAYSDTERQELLDGVERIARSARETIHDPSVTTAISILAIIALDPSIAAPESREIPRRLMRIYRETDRVNVRSLAIMRLGDMLAVFPEESEEIAEVLTSVASAPFSPGQVHPMIAIDALRNAGEAGLPALRRLHEDNLVQDPATRAHIQALAKNGFPARESKSPLR